MSSDQADFVRELGALVLDHRLKRLMRRLLDEAEAVYESDGVSFKPRWVSTFLLLAREGALPVTDIASRLGITHPAVIQVTDAMVGAGLVQIAKDPGDARRRLLRLTGKGRALRPRLETIWEALASEQEELFAELDVSVMSLIDDVERSLEKRGLAERVRQRLTTQFTKQGKK